MSECRLGYGGGCKLDRYRASIAELLHFHDNPCNSQLKNCLYTEKYPGLKRLVAEEFADDLIGFLKSVMTDPKERGIVFRAVKDSLKEGIPINNEQIWDQCGLTAGMYKSSELCEYINGFGHHPTEFYYRLNNLQDFFEHRWLSVFQRFQDSSCGRAKHKS